MDNTALYFSANGSNWMVCKSSGYRCMASLIQRVCKGSGYNAHSIVNSGGKDRSYNANGIINSDSM